MAGKNQVTLTFAGDEDQLLKSMQKVGSGADQMAADVDQAADRVDAAGRSSAEAFDRAAEATDDFEGRAQGFRSTLEGTGDTMEGVSQIARGNLYEGLILAGGGVADLSEGFTKTLIPAAKAGVTAITNFVSTTRGMLISLGAVGLAIGAAIVIYEAFNNKADATVAVNQELANTLDSVSGAVTENTRTWVANELETKGALQAARTLGVSYRDLIDAALGNADAHDRIFDAVARANEGVAAGSDRNTELNDSLQTMLEGMEGVRGELLDAQGAWERTTEAIEGNTAGIVHQLDTLQELADTLKAQSDPIFAFVAAQQRAREAQRGVNEARDEFGRGSRQHREALLDLASAELDLFDATGAAADAVGGSLIPALEQMVEDGELSRAAFRELRRAIRDAERAARDADGTVVRITEEYTTVYEQIGQAPVGGRSVPTFASGGWHSGGLAVVGEEGPELVDMPAGSRVYSHAESMSMIRNLDAAGGYGWGGGGGRITIELRSGPAEADQFLTNWFYRQLNRNPQVRAVIAGVR